MSSLLPLAVLGACVGAAIATFFHRRVRDALIAQAVAGVTAQAGATQAELTARLSGAEERREDILVQLRAATEAIAARDQHPRTAQSELTTLRTKETTFATRLEELTKSQGQLKEAFQSLCGEALKSNNEQFLQLAWTELEWIRVTAQAELTEKETAIQTLIAPIRDGLEKHDKKLSDIKVARVESFASLAQRIDGYGRAFEHLCGVSGTCAGAAARLAGW